MRATEAAPNAEAVALRARGRAALVVGAEGLGAALAVAFAATALGEASGALPFPPALAAALASIPNTFRLHMIGAALAVLAMLAALGAPRHSRAHRVAGRLAVALVVASGLAAVPVALEGAGPPLAKAGFLAQAALWVGLALRGLALARARRWRAHADAMVLLLAVTAGAALARALLRLPNPLLSPEGHYALVAWASWLLPVAATLALRRARRRPQRPRLGAASSTLPLTGRAEP